jgi:cytochrome oxidase assembly protein ShyY1
VWLPGETIYDSGREHAGRQGYWAVTPVAVDGATRAASGPGRAPAILVVRGWAPDPEGVPEPTGRTDLTGWMQPSEGSGVPDPAPDDDVLPELRIASVVQRMGRDLYGGYVIRDVSAGAEGSTGSVGGDPAGGDGLAPVTPASLPEPSTFTSIRNLLYAGEWWVFGAFAAFIWWRWCRDAIHASREPERELAEVASGS